jgi:hypothetical protein
MVLVPEAIPVDKPRLSSQRLSRNMTAPLPRFHCRGGSIQLRRHWCVVGLILIQLAFCLIGVPAYASQIELTDALGRKVARQPLSLWTEAWIVSLYSLKELAKSST